MIKQNQMWHVLLRLAKNDQLVKKGSSSNAFPTFRNRPTDSAKGLTFKSPRNLERLCPASSWCVAGTHSLSKPGAFCVDLFRLLLCYVDLCWTFFQLQFLVIEYVGIIIIIITFSDLSTSCSDLRGFRFRIPKGYPRPRARAHQDSSASVGCLFHKNPHRFKTIRFMRCFKMLVEVIS